MAPRQKRDTPRDTATSRKAAEFAQQEGIFADLPIGLCPLDYGPSSTASISNTLPAKGSGSLVPLAAQQPGASLGLVLEASAIIEQSPLFNNGGNQSDSSLSSEEDKEEGAENQGIIKQAGSSLNVTVVAVKGKGKGKGVERPGRVGGKGDVRRSGRSKV
jgi:hypothetical protein